MGLSADCIVIGGGPAGLTAASYLARFRLDVLVVDAGQSRAALIPCTRNHAGFPEGISGLELLERMSDQASKYGARRVAAQVLHLERNPAGFTALTQDAAMTARTILIATGVTNLRPQLIDRLHAQALAQGRLRYCPVCDGFEVTGKAVAVICTGQRGMKEAIFLRSYTRDVTLVPNEGAHDLGAEDCQQLAALAVAILEAPALDFRLEDDAITFQSGESRRSFESIYPALGSDIHSGLAADVGAERPDEGCIRVDAHQRTTVPGLYAAGDVWWGWTRSVMPWARRALRQRPSAMTWARSRLFCAKPVWPLPLGDKSSAKRLASRMTALPCRNVR